MSATEARSAAVREFAQAYLRRMSHDASDAPASDALQHEVLGAFELADGRGKAAIAVRAFNPTVADHGYDSQGSVLETNTDDLPFLVDSVSAELRARGLVIRRVLHPIIGAERDAAGRIVRVLHPGEGASSESVMHFDLDRHLTPEELAVLEDGVRAVLADVRAVVGDFAAMRERVGRMVEAARAGAARHDAAAIEETVAFLEWLQNGNFIFLGYREYELNDDALAVVTGSGLGLLADETVSSWAQPVAVSSLPPERRPRTLAGELLVVAKTNNTSTVHRRARMDYIGIGRCTADGSVAGEARMLGHFTTRAYLEPASQTPLIAGKLRTILGAEDLIEGSHDYKAAVALFESFPKDELFAAPVDDLRRAVVALLAVPDDELRLLGRRDADGRSASLIVALPKARYDGALLERLRGLMRERFAAEDVDVHEVMAEDEHVRIHFRVHASAGNLPEISFRDLEAEVAELTRTWDDRARDRLVDRHGEERGRMLAARWLPRLPGSYKATVTPDAVVDDIAGFERLVASPEGFTVGLRNEQGPGVDALTRVGLYRSGPKVELSRAMGLLENLGLRVVEERPARLLGGDSEIWLQDFGVLGPSGAVIDLDECGDRIADCIAATWRGDAESDSLNRLVVTAGLDWRRVTILRAYRKYRQRIGSRFTESYQNDVIAANPQLAAKLLRMFELRFDPSTPRDEAAEAALRDEILVDVDAVVSLDHDRILRNQLEVIEATVRTNAYRAGRGPIAFKLRSAEVPAIPQPPPLFEIYVYSPEMEGIHIRGGSIARGGIRWSDRMDYRTEVFGLMRAQMVKNAVIVPAGAKGGFYLKQPPPDPGALRAEVERQYVAYIGALLEVTDNRAPDGAIVHPEGVRVLDDPDSYLVVAADKGTATFSDTANAVSERHGFWLGDAFASGGSAGYDHKALGITARGAWESVKRHFRDLGLDPAQDLFTAVGIGDMSGDVFGNGTLLSDRMKLVAAYDHRHVFIDPDPDPAQSYTERRRLFELAGSSWDDYEREAISAGGGVWSRSAKSIPLSEQARAALGIEDEALAPTDVIRAILRAPVDLLFNGGIGTVVKAAAESDADALDRSSDAIRVDARDLRCRVIGEGGNLGLTQRGRIEFARGGGLVNADFIDNSAGVDCSDHEVNLKILLGLAEQRGELERASRDELLEQVTDDVTAHVLYDSFLQAQILSQEAPATAWRMDDYEDLIAGLEADGLLDRTLDVLPTSEDMADRRRAGEGLQRPELAVLLAHAKRGLTETLLASDLVDDPWLEHDLLGYFPPAVVERFGGLIAEHPLRRELVATLEANMALNALGPTFVSRLVGETGAEPAEVVRAYRIAREVTRASERWDAVERLGRAVSAEVGGELMAGVDWLVEAVTRWCVGEQPGADMADAIAVGIDGFDRLTAAMPSLRSEHWRTEGEARMARLVEQGVPAELARAHAFQPALVHAADVIAVARAAGRPLEEVGEAFFRLGEALRLEDLEHAVLAVPAHTRIQRWALQALFADALRARAELVQRAVDQAPDAPATEAVERFLASTAEAIARHDEFRRSLPLDGADDLSALSLAVRQLRALVD